VDGWIVNSEAIADSMAGALNIDRSRFIVVGNVVNCEAFRSSLSRLEARRRLGLETNGGTVSIIAGLRPQKNHALFVRMAELLLKERRKTNFLIVGDGELRPSLEAQIRTLGIADRIMLLGKRPDIPDILAATDVSVLTSHREGIPNALLESMAAGIPVVTTDYSGARELVTDGQDGCIVPSGDAAALAQAVGRLLDDASLRARMGQQGRKTVETRFSGREVSTALVLAYQRVLETSRR
jgi:glycosyltransferase involved in cell wall biosynthesis